VAIFIALYFNSVIAFEWCCIDYYRSPIRPVSTIKDYKLRILGNTIN